MFTWMSVILNYNRHFNLSVVSVVLPVVHGGRVRGISVEAKEVLTGFKEDFTVKTVRW